MAADQKKEYLPLERLVGWNKNPRSMNEGDEGRLKTQLLELGQYKPLLVVKDGEHYVVLGGNMRLKAMKALLAEGNEAFANVWVSYVDAPTEKRKLEYALSDNDRAGSYNEDQLVDMIRAVGDLALEDYHIDTSYTMDLSALVDRYDMADTRANGAGAEDADRSTKAEDKITYDTNKIKQIVTYFNDEEYRWMLELLERVCAAQGLQNNTEAIILMAKEYEQNHSV